MNNDKYVLDEAGEPVLEPDIYKWAKWFENADRHLAEDTLDDGDAYVSTVFLGLDHSFVSASPVLWETMIFGGKQAGYSKRYMSRADALAGHAEAVKLVKKDL